MENNEPKNSTNKPTNKAPENKTANLASKATPKNVGPKPQSTSASKSVMGKASPSGVNQSPKTIQKTPATHPVRQNEVVKPKVQEIDSSAILHKEDNTEKKKKNRKLLLLLLLLLLIVGGAGTAIFFITQVPKTDMKFSIITETTFNNIEIDDGGQQQEISYIPGDEIEASLNIKIQNDKGTITNSEKVYLRFKIDIIIDGNNYYGGLFDANFDYPDEWQHSSSDNYYYYKYVCYGNENLTPFEKLNFVAERYNNMLNGKTGKIIFTVEILEGNPSAISSLWQTAPQNWNPTTKN